MIATVDLLPLCISLPRCFRGEGQDEEDREVWERRKQEGLALEARYRREAAVQMAAAGNNAISGNNSSGGSRDSRGGGGHHRVDAAGSNHSLLFIVLWIYIVPLHTVRD